MRALHLYLLAACLHAAQPLPKFDDFPAGEVFNGRPAPPKLVTPSEKLFRTRIRQGGAEGPKFAANFAIAQWGCGSGCVSMAFVNSEDGAIHWAPFGILGFGDPPLRFEGKLLSDNHPPISVRLNSRLLIVRGCLEDEAKACATHF